MALTSRLAAKQVEYLCFEGGGGKGLVYPAALDQLNREGVRWDGPQRSIRGVSGASAGALTAAMVAMGWPVELISKWSGDRERFAKIFPEDELPSVSRFICRWKGVLKQGLARTTPRKPGDKFVEALGRNIDWLAAADVLLKLLPKSSFVDAVNKYKYGAIALASDGGMYPGVQLHGLVRDVIGCGIERLGRERGEKDSAETINFGAFRKAFNVDLRVTATNLSTQRGQVFSADATPSFPVVAAITISMSLPVVFRPVRVVWPALSASDRDLTGVWADGGLLNNLPIRAFNGEESRAHPRLKPTMLALRLSDNPTLAKDVASQTMCRSGLMPTWDSVYGTTTLFSEEDQLWEPAEGKFQTLTLPTAGLSAVEFSPEEKVLKDASEAARSAVSDYFRTPVRK